MVPDGMISEPCTEHDLDRADGARTVLLTAVRSGGLWCLRVITAYCLAMLSRSNAYLGTRQKLNGQPSVGGEEKVGGGWVL